MDALIATVSAAAYIRPGSGTLELGSLLPSVTTAHRDTYRVVGINLEPFRFSQTRVLGGFAPDLPPSVPVVGRKP